MFPIVSALFLISISFSGTGRTIVIRGGGGAKKAARREERESYDRAEGEIDSKSQLE